MSRIGKQPVKVPSGVKVELNNQLIKISGTSATLTLDVRDEIKVEYDSGAGEIKVIRTSDDRFCRSLHGTIRSLIANMIEGVTKGFKKELKIYGSGYGVKVQGQNMTLQVGFAQPAVLPIPQGISVEIKTPNARGNEVPAEFSVSGPDKYVVGQFAAAARKVRPPEPYLGKGIRYADEVIRRKVGKAFASGA